MARDATFPKSGGSNVWAAQRVVIKTVTAAVKAIRSDRNKFVRNGARDRPNAR